MKYDVMGLLRNAALTLQQAGDSGTAYALLEMGNNLRLVMRGEETLEAWKTCYSGEDGEPFDLDKLCPGPDDAG